MFSNFVFDLEALLKDMIRCINLGYQLYGYGVWECNITGIPSALQNLLFKKKIEKSLYESNVFFLDLCFLKFFDIHIRNISTPVIPPLSISTLNLMV